jgi:hypothetical protein
MRLVLAILAAATFLAAADLGENPITRLTARMAQMDRERLQTLDRYTGTLHYVLNNRRFKTHAEMTVRMAYGTGGKKEFQVLSESGSEWIRKYVFRRLIRAEQENAQGAAHHETRITHYKRAPLLGCDLSGSSSKSNALLRGESECTCNI